MIEPHGRHLGHAELFGRQYAGVAADEVVAGVDQHGYVEAKRRYALAKLFDLPRWVRARIARLELQIGNRPPYDHKSADVGATVCYDVLPHIEKWLKAKQASVRPM
jgi:hypothetical protein